MALSKDDAAAPEAADVAATTAVTTSADPADSAERTASKVVNIGKERAVVHRDQEFVRLGGTGVKLGMAVVFAEAGSAVVWRDVTAWDGTSIEDFGPDRQPFADELQVYTWRDATLKELSTLIKEVNSDARRKEISMSFNMVYMDLRGMFHVRELGLVHNARKTETDDRTLDEARFATGDYIDVAILRHVGPRDRDRPFQARSTPDRPWGPPPQRGPFDSGSAGRRASAGGPAGTLSDNATANSGRDRDGNIDRERDRVKEWDRDRIRDGDRERDRDRA